MVTLDSCAALGGGLGREFYRRSLRRNFPIDRFAPQDCEGDARHLVGKRHRDKLEGLLVDQLLRPHPQRVGVRLAMKQHRMRTHDEQFAQVPIAIFEMRPSFGLPPEEFCLGVNPRKAANSRGPAKRDAS